MWLSLIICYFIRRTFWNSFVIRSKFVFVSLNRSWVLEDYKSIDAFSCDMLFHLENILELLVSFNRNSSLYHLIWVRSWKIEINWCIPIICCFLFCLENILNSKSNSIGIRLVLENLNRLMKSYHMLFRLENMLNSKSYSIGFCQSEFVIWIGILYAVSWVRESFTSQLCLIVFGNECVVMSHKCGD